MGGSRGKISKEEPSTTVPEKRPKGTTGKMGKEGEFCGGKQCKGNYHYRFDLWDGIIWKLAENVKILPGTVKSLRGSQGGMILIFREKYSYIIRRNVKIQHNISPKEEQSPERIPEGMVVLLGKVA